MANFFDDDKLNENDSLNENDESMDLSQNSNLLEEDNNDISSQETSIIENTDSEQEETVGDNAQSDSVVTTEADTSQESQTQDKPKKEKKPLSKKSKIVITVTVATIAVILLGIVLPIVLYHAPRIFVKSAEDFVAGDKVGSIGKYFYVLDNDITADTLTLEGQNVYSIDLHKHSLTVKNDMNITTDAKGTMYIGTRKSDTEYTSKKANLKAKTLNINAPNLDIVIAANLVCEQLNVNARSITFASTSNGEYSNIIANISAETVKFTGNIKASAGSVINITNAANVTVNSNVTIDTTLNLTDSFIASAQNSTISNLVLNENSTASIAGNITTAIKGGKQVVMEAGHNCVTYQDINTLVIFRNTGISNVIKNCKNVIYVEKLLAPNDINIEEIDGKIYCVVSKVAFASSYNYYIDDELVKNTSETRLDITEFVKEAGKYNIKVVPVGNYVAGMDLTNQSSTTMYTDGDAISTTYNCVFNLQAPQNLKVTNKDGVITLTFNAVTHAESYKIIIDGKEIKRSDATLTSEDITQYVGTVGNHTIRVQALNSNENIHNSEESMVSYYHTERLEPVTDIKATLNEDNTIINTQWTSVVNGYEYKIQLKIDNGALIEVGRTSILNGDGTMSFSINLADLGLEYSSNHDYTVIVTALGHDYYTESTQSSVTIPKVAAETQPQQ